MDIDSGSSVPHDSASSSSSSSSSVAPTLRSASRIVFPGDILSLSGSNIKLGSGLVQSSFVGSLLPPPSSAASSGANHSSPASGSVIATKCGLLHRTDASNGTHSLSLLSSVRRYAPIVDDLVLGVVCDQSGENYRVDIGSSQPALLPFLAFEGANKRNRPNLLLGALVYARVVLTARDVEVELSCTSAHFTKDWSTGQSLFGEVVGGYCVHTSSRLARDLLNEQSEGAYVLGVLGKYVPYEIAIGANGRVWINSASHQHTILVTNAILNSEAKSKEHVTSLVQKIMQAL